MINAVYLCMYVLTPELCACHHLELIPMITYGHAD